MAINDFDRDRFVAVLQAQLSPAGPLESIEHLKGRSIQLEKISQASAAIGRHIFIFGDRGVGKSSLAHTVAIQHQSSDKPPIVISCESDSTFRDVVRGICDRIRKSPIASKVINTNEMSMNANVLSGKASVQVQQDMDIMVRDIDHAVHLVQQLGNQYSDKTVIVVDEFDLIKSPTEKRLFSEFIKQMGDHKVNIQFIFCGIGKSLDDLLDGHGSSYRYLEAIELAPLSFSARWEIIDQVMGELGLKINQDSRLRIAATSQGFPYYVHLICEKLLWHIFSQEEVITCVEPEHYMLGLGDAIDGISQQLKKNYTKATERETDNYHYFLWAVADHFELERSGQSIFHSYQNICAQLGTSGITLTSFSAELRKLESESFGSMLDKNYQRKGWYRFRENIERGYVRMRAEAHGVQLRLEAEPNKAPKGENVPSQKLAAAGRVGSSSFGKTNKW